MKDVSFLLDALEGLHGGSLAHFGERGQEFVGTFDLSRIAGAFFVLATGLNSLSLARQFADTRSAAPPHWNLSRLTSVSSVPLDWTVGCFPSRGK